MVVTLERYDKNYEHCCVRIPFLQSADPCPVDSTPKRGKPEYLN